MVDTMAEIAKTEFFNNINDCSIRSIRSVRSVRSSCFALFRLVTRIVKSFQQSLKSVGDRSDLHAPTLKKEKNQKKEIKLNTLLKRDEEHGDIRGSCPAIPDAKRLALIILNVRVKKHIAFTTMG